MNADETKIKIDQRTQRFLCALFHSRKKVDQLKYKLISCANVSVKEITFLIIEAINQKEYINPLWKAYSLGVDDFRRHLDLQDRQENQERVLAFIVEKDLVGVCRITPEPKHIENGKVGFYIRPTKRKMKYAPAMLRMIEDYAREQVISCITAVVDINNLPSISALRSAGWEETGTQYAWKGGRTAVEFRPSPCGK